MATDTAIPEGFTAEEWNMLSEEEQEGLRSIEKDDVNPDTLAAVAGDDDVEDDNVQADDTQATDTSANVAAADTQVNDTKVEPATDTDFFKSLPKDDQELLAYRPDVRLEIPSDTPPEFQEKLDALDNKFEAGDLTQREYNKQRDAIRDELTQARLEVAENVRTQKIWDKEIDAFLSVHKEYTEQSVRGQALFGALDQTVISIAKANPQLSGMQVLLKAHHEVQAVFAPKQEAAPKVEDKKTDRRPDTKKPDIKTLADVPLSAQNSTEDPYSALDKLEGEAYEAALLKMPDDQRKAYLARV